MSDERFAVDTMSDADTDSPTALRAMRIRFPLRNPANKEIAKQRLAMYSFIGDASMRILLLLILLPLLSSALHAQVASAFGGVNSTLNGNTYPASAAFVSGGIPFYSSTTTEAPSALLTNHGLLVGGGAAAAPAALAVGGANFPLLGVAAANPAFSTIAYPTSLTSGGILYGSSTTQLASSGLLTANAVVIGGGAGTTPTTIPASTTTTQALFATATAPAFRALAATDLPATAQLTISTPAGTPTFTPGTNVTSVVCAAGYTCTNARGELTIVGGTATTGTIATVNFSTTLTAAPGMCIVTQQGGGSLFDIGHGVPSTTAFTVTAGVTVAAATLAVDYVCQP